MTVLRRCELKERAAPVKWTAARAAAHGGGAIESAQRVVGSRRVSQQGCLGGRAILTAGEGVKHGFGDLRVGGTGGGKDGCGGEGTAEIESYMVLHGSGSLMAAILVLNYDLLARRRYETPGLSSHFYYGTYPVPVRLNTTPQPPLHIVPLPP
jgi:hypothetical protein